MPHHPQRRTLIQALGVAALSMGFGARAQSAPEVMMSRVVVMTTPSGRPVPALAVLAEIRLSAAVLRSYFLPAAALPPLRPAFFFWAVVPPWELSPPEPPDLPPRCEAPSELVIFAARDFDMPLSLRPRTAYPSAQPEQPR